MPGRWAHYVLHNRLAQLGLAQDGFTGGCRASRRSLWCTARGLFLGTSTRDWAVAYRQRPDGAARLACLCTVADFLQWRDLFAACWA
jgi:hypothetical protein